MEINNEGRKHYALINCMRIVYIVYKTIVFFCSWIWLKQYSVSRCSRDDLDRFWFSDDVSQEIQPECCWPYLPCRHNSRASGFNLRWPNEHEVRQQSLSFIRKVSLF